MIPFDKHKLTVRDAFRNQAGMRLIDPVIIHTVNQHRDKSATASDGIDDPGEKECQTTQQRLETEQINIH